MIGRHRVLILLVCLAAIPSLCLAWRWRGLEHLGIYHDDSIYWVAAKSLAEGNGYRIESLPGQPYQTKYPPLYPALLSLVWRLNPDFPGNLPLAMLMNWLLLPLYLWVAWRLYGDFGFDARLAAFFCVLLALNPIVVNLSVMLMTEILFGALVMASLILAERAGKAEGSWRLALAAGVAGGLSFLTRSSALALLVSAPLALVWSGRWRRAALYAAGMAPAVVGWQVWSRTHMAPGVDLVTLYYTDYIGFHLANVSWAEMPRQVWLNLGALAFGLSELIVFSDSITFWSQQLARLVAIAGIAGTVRLAKSGGLKQYPAFAMVFLFQSLFWHYPPHNRFVLPVLPLLIAGFWTEMRHVAGIVRVSWVGGKLANRLAAVVGGGAVAALALLIGYRIHFGLRVFLPTVIGQHRSVFQANRAAYEWLTRHSSPEERVFAYSDPLVYLYAGRRGLSARIPPHLLYRGDRGGIESFVRTVPAITRRHGLTWVLFTASDFQFDSPELGLSALKRMLVEDPAFELSYQAPQAAIYRVH